MGEEPHEDANKALRHPDIRLGGGHSARAKAESDLERTIAAPLAREAQEIRAAEGEVPRDWHVGDVILDLYEVKDIHKGGGMGLVYRVRHRGWNLDLAVKSPRADYFQTEEQKETFVRECETWSDLGLHPHTVSCYYVRTLGGIPRVFAEYIEGGVSRTGFAAGSCTRAGSRRRSSASSMWRSRWRGGWAMRTSGA